MPKIIFVEHDGAAHEIEAAVGRSVMQAAVDNSVPGILADCGGSCSCGTCHGFIDAPWAAKVPAVKSDEASMLEGLLEAQSNSRLTCQIDVTPDLDGMIVRLPKSQL